MADLIQQNLSAVEADGLKKFFDLGHKTCHSY
jgi:hypothetical protein